MDAQSLGNDGVCGNGVSREREVLRCDASWRGGGGIESGVSYQPCAVVMGGERAGLPIEEGKYFIFPDGPTETAAVLVESIVIAIQATLCGSAGVIRADAVPALIGVEAGTGGLEECAAVEAIGTAFGSDLNLRTAEAAVLRVIAVGDDLQVVDRVFTGGNDRRAAPHSAYGANAVDADAVVLILAAGTLNLRAVLGGEYAGAAAGPAGSLIPGQSEGPTATLLGRISEDSRRELCELKNVAIE